MGFGGSPGVQRIYANSAKCGDWYILNYPSREPEIIPYPALTGFLVGLQYVEEERRQKAVMKMQATIRTDSECYMIESGSETHFTQGLIKSIAKIDVEFLKAPITIERVLGTEGENVMFCRVYDSKSNPIRYEKTDDFLESLAIAQNKVDIARGRK
jgi:hypothetical protein